MPTTTKLKTDMAPEGSSHGGVSGGRHGGVTIVPVSGSGWSALGCTRYVGPQATPVTFSSRVVPAGVAAGFFATAMDGGTYGALPERSLPMM